MQSCQILICKCITLEFFHCTLCLKKFKEFQFQARLPTLKIPFWHKPAPDGSWSLGEWSWLAVGEKDAGRVWRLSSSTLKHFLMVHFFFVIYRQILLTLCILERNICSLKCLRYFRALAIWKIGILRDADKTVAFIVMFSPAILGHNTVTGKSLSFLSINSVSVIDDQ